MAKDLISAVEGGDRRAALEAIRDRLGAELAAAEGKDAATLAKELRAVITELDSMTGGEESALDDLAARREARRANAASS